MFKHKRRSAHGTYSSTQSQPISRPTDAAGAVQASSMGSSGEQTPVYYVDSVIARASPDADAKVHGDAQGPFHEPLVMDFATLQDGINGSRPAIAMSPSKVDASWLSDDETAAAAPPDISVRRDISHHVPLRTR